MPPSEPAKLRSERDAVIQLRPVPTVIPSKSSVARHAKAGRRAVAPTAASPRVFAWAVISVAFACGGASSSELLTGSSTAGASTSGSSTGGGGAGGSSSGANGGGTAGGSARATAGASTGASTGANTGAATEPDAGARGDPFTDGGSGTGTDGATHDPGAPPIYCGDTNDPSVARFCAAPDVCCATATDKRLYRCDARAACAGVPITCRTSTDCSGGETCCAEATDTAWTAIGCRADCQSTAAVHRAAACDATSAGPDPCLVGTSCTTIEFPGFAVCR